MDINADTRDLICIRKFGHRIFVDVDQRKKTAICKNLEEGGAIIYTHLSPYMFAVGRATIGLHMFV